MKSLVRKIVLLWLVAPVVVMAAETDSLAKIAGSGPAAERAAVVKVLQDYLRVTDFRDEDAIGKSFHPAALLGSVTASGARRA